MPFERFTTAESLADTRGVEHNYLPNVPIALLDTREDSTQVRNAVNRHIKALVRRYAEYLGGGTKMPAVLVYVQEQDADGNWHYVSPTKIKTVKDLTKNGRRIVLLDGNHRRLAAIRNGDEQIAIHCLGLDGIDARLFSAEVNGTNGQAPDRDERLAIAEAALRAGRTQVYIRATVGLPPSTINNLSKEIEFEARIERMGIEPDEVRTLTAAHRRALLRVDNDPSFLEAIRLVNDAGLDTKSTAEVVGAVKDETSQDGELTKLQNLRTDYSDEIAAHAAGVGTRPRPAVTSRKHTTGLVKMKVEDPAVDRWVPRELDSLTQMIADLEVIVPHLTDVLAACKVALDAMKAAAASDEEDAA